MTQPIILKDFDPAELQELADIQQRCHKLHVMPPSVLKLEMQVFDRDGNPLSVYRDLARSWVRNNYNFVTMQQMGLAFGELGTTYGAGTMVMKRTNGTNDASTTSLAQQRYPNDTTTDGFRSGGGITAYGIVVGTSNTAESFESHALGTLIADGTGAGQMSYAAMAVPVATWSGVTKKFTLEVIRYINNNSGGSITVKEVGLYSRLQTISGLLTQDYMLARDLVNAGAGVAVADAAQLQVKYTIESATYPV